MNRLRSEISGFFKKHISAHHLFLCGLLIIPAFLFTDMIILKIAQTLVFLAMVFLVGKRIRILPPLILSASVVFFNVLSPFGEILFSIGPFPVTRGALEAGILRAVTLVGLVFLSQFAVRPDLSIPGRFGMLLAKVFFYFERITESGKSFDRKNIMKSLDSILLSAYASGIDVTERSRNLVKTSFPGWMAISALFLFNYAMLGIWLFGRR